MTEERYQYSSAYDFPEDLDLREVWREPPDDTVSALTAGELADALSSLPPEMPVRILYDCGCAEGTVVAVKVDGDTADLTVE